MSLLNYFTNDPLIDEGLRHAHDPAALKAWATRHADQFGVKFFLKLDSQVRQANEAHAQESKSWGSSFEDRANYNLAMLRGGQASENAERSKALTRVGMAALSACGPRALEWAKSAVGKFLGGLREKMAALPPGNFASDPFMASQPPTPASSPAALQPPIAQSRHTVFLSHSRDDLVRYGTLKEVEKMLADSQFFSPWIDHHGIEVGDHLWSAIEKAISECFAFVVIWSRHAAKSKAVQDELQVAHRHGKRIIVCLVEPPDSNFEVPFGLLGIPFFPGRYEASLGLSQLNQILMSMLAETYPQAASIQNGLADVKTFQATLEHHSIRRRAGPDRPDTVSFIKPMVANMVQSLSRDPDKEPSMLLFCQRLLKTLEEDLSIETNEQVFDAARRVYDEVNPVCSDPLYALALKSIISQPTGP